MSKVNTKRTTLLDYSPHFPIVKLLLLSYILLQRQTTVYNL